MNLHERAILKADEIRTQLGLDMFEPINIFDSCNKLGLTVRFVDVNMEGLYVKQKNGLYPTVILSSQRPLPRRCFTCAHELGHHVFGHGLMIDVLSDWQNVSPIKDSNELLVDSFASALLMPYAGIQAEFGKRKWSIRDASPIEFYTICSVFGVGYQTLITNCRANRLINKEKAELLLKYKPGMILSSILTKAGLEKSYFKIIDDFYKTPVIDLEVTNYAIFSSDILVEGDHLQKVDAPLSEKSVYIAVKSGLVRVMFENSKSFLLEFKIKTILDFLNIVT